MAPAFFQCFVFAVGLDATISEGHKDLKFINIYQEPLTILTTAEDRTLTVSLQLHVEKQDTECAGTMQDGEESSQTITDNSSEPIKNEEIGPAFGIPQEVKGTEQDE